MYEGPPRPDGYAVASAGVAGALASPVLGGAVTWPDFKAMFGCSRLLATGGALCALDSALFPQSALMVHGPFRAKFFRGDMRANGRLEEIATGSAKLTMLGEACSIAWKGFDHPREHLTRFSVCTGVFVLASCMVNSVVDMVKDING
jgi:hypothetical protein